MNEEENTSDYVENISYPYKKKICVAKKLRQAINLETVSNLTNVR